MTSQFLLVCELTLTIHCQTSKLEEIKCIMQNEPVCKTDVITEAPTRAIIFYFFLEIRNIFVLQNTI